jgi:PPK2 family polyphosphate:nucleotide phosphotransferase
VGKGEERVGAGWVATLAVAPETRARLGRRDPGDTCGLDSKARAVEDLEALIGRMQVLQNRLWAEQRRAVLVVLQGLDASGKDGTIRRVFTGVNPQGCEVTSFKVPTPNELAHDYLWRCHAACPARGEIAIWNRSHYEDLVTTRVLGLVDDEQIRRRYRHVRAFERLLVDEGTRIVKVFLHLSRDEQRRRLQRRIDDPERRWKFRPDDLETRRRWDEFLAAYDDAISATSTTWAPWYVVPADHKWVRDVVVASLLVATLTEMDPRLPEPDPGIAGLRVE